MSSLVLNFPITFQGFGYAAVARCFHSRWSTFQTFVCKPLHVMDEADAASSVAGQPSIVLDSLRVLQWDEVCDCVASFAGTSLGKQRTKELLWNLDGSYEGSMKLLQETNAAVEMHNYGAMMDFIGIDVAHVETSIKCARRGSPVGGVEAIALRDLLKYAESLQLNVTAAVKEDSNWFMRFMPLSELILELNITHPLIKFIEQLVDEDGSVKDSASSSLRQARNQVRLFERKLYELMEAMIRNKTDGATLEVFSIDGRWCIKSDADGRTKFEGLLLASSREGTAVEPLPAVPLNDELGRARESVRKAEEEVLLRITKKMQMDLDDIEKVLVTMIRIDMINARARYSLSFGGACPDLYLPQDENSAVAEFSDQTLSQRKWAMYLPRAYHPLLLHQHRHNLRVAEKDLNDAKVEIRRRKMSGSINRKGERNLDLSAMEMQIYNLKNAPPIPFDIHIAHNTKVVVITGPNTGGKTICLKTIGLAAMMAKSGLYVLASESARIPWFDFVLADIGDEQSLLQSLSTFSGHLKQISDIKSLSTRLSLVLLDEVGAGTNPLEGAAFGMSLLESFAEHSSALLTISTTHHGELKALKYINPVFENACMEFDEINLKPTYKILWGVPGRSNAINIAERLGLRAEILDNARDLYGAASAEINELIVDMERFKQDYHHNIQEAQHYLGLSEQLHASLVSDNNRVLQHAMKERIRIAEEISKVAASARSIIHKKLRDARALVRRNRSKQLKENRADDTSASTSPPVTTGETTSSVDTTPAPADGLQKLTKKKPLPKVGDMVNVPSLNLKAKVMKLDPLKQEMVVQAGNLKLNVKMADVLL